MVKIKRSISLIVSSCDKYEDAWYPYFELVKKYWPEHPNDIYLISETKNYSCEGLNITSCNYGFKSTWSERLYKTLKKTETKYIIFSLEDFFLQSRVDQNRIDECISWMENDENIAVCRLYAGGHKLLEKAKEYRDFGYAKNDIHFRLETQMAIWNRETLMSFIDLTEDPWQFERNGSKRIKDTNKKFLWFMPKDNVKPIVDYSMLVENGYGITQDHWLWKNKELFRNENINNVKFYRLGVLSEKTIKLRKKHYKNKNKNLFERIIRPFWRVIVLLRIMASNIIIFGFLRGIKYTWIHR